MTDASKPAQAAPQSPEAQALARVKELREKITQTQSQLLTLEGKLRNRDPNRIARLKKENEDMTKRFALVKKSLFAIIAESYQPRSEDEWKLQYEALRKATVEYCKKAKVDPQLCKSIAS